MAERLCGWCRRPLEVTARRDQRFCSAGCRQWAFRLRRRRATATFNAQPHRFAYADPPYPGLARRYYGDQPTYAGEVDHAALVAQLEQGGYAGWALSTSSKALRHVLALCPEGARVCPWVKPNGVSSRRPGPQNTWEPLIVVGGRRVLPGCRDWLSAKPARGGGTLPGRKPIAFCAFLFQQLGMLPGDELVDLFPGTGVVSRAWAELSRRDPLRAAAGDALSQYSGDTFARASSDALGPGLGDTSPEVLGDALPRGKDDASREVLGDDIVLASAR